MITTTTYKGTKYLTLKSTKLFNILEPYAQKDPDSAYDKFGRTMIEILHNIEKTDNYDKLKELHLFKIVGEDGAVDYRWFPDIYSLDHVEYVQKGRSKGIYIHDRCCHNGSIVHDGCMMEHSV